jgi:hypothetical protein
MVERSLLSCQEFAAAEQFAGSPRLIAKNRPPLLESARTGKINCRIGVESVAPVQDGL